ncbi:MAG: hypothetical protein AAFO91_00035 [Bacteroidota bacterium]
MHKTELTVNDSYSPQSSIFSTQFNESEVGILVPVHVLHSKNVDETVEASYSEHSGIMDRHFLLSPVWVKLVSHVLQRACLKGVKAKEWDWQLVISETQYPGFWLSYKIYEELQLVQSLEVLMAVKVSKAVQFDVVTTH